MHSSWMPSWETLITHWHHLILLYLIEMHIFPQHIDSRRKWLFFRCEIRAMTTNNSISRLLNHTGWSAWCTEMKLCCVFYNTSCVYGKFIFIFVTKRNIHCKNEKKIICVYVNDWDYHKCWNGFRHRVGTIGVNICEQTYPKNLCEMAACYRLHTTVEFYTKVAEELLIFLPHMSPDNFASKSPVEPHVTNEGVFCGSSSPLLLDIRIHICPDITMLWGELRLFYVVGIKFCYLCTSDK